MRTARFLLDDGDMFDGDGELSTSDHDQGGGVARMDDGRRKTIIMLSPSSLRVIPTRISPYFLHMLDG